MEAGFALARIVESVEGDMSEPAMAPDEVARLVLASRAGDEVATLRLLDQYRGLLVQAVQRMRPPMNPPGKT